MAKKIVHSGKSAFVRKVLGENPKATHLDVIAEWKKSGKKDDISGPLYYKTRQRLGLKGKRRRRKGAVAVAMTATEGPSKNDAYAAIEAGLDKLLVQAIELKDAPLAESIRAARRKASAKLA